MIESRSRYLRVDRRDLAYLKFIIESYEGLAVLSTVEPRDAVVRIGYPGCSEDDLSDLLRALAAEIRLMEVPRPVGYRDGLPDMPKREVY